MDAAVVALPVSEPLFFEVALFKEQFLLVRPGDEEGTPVPSRKKLRSMKLLVLEEGHCFRDQALSFCKMQSSLPREALGASSLSTLVARRKVFWDVPPLALPHPDCHKSEQLQEPPRATA